MTITVSGIELKPDLSLPKFNGRSVALAISLPKDTQEKEIKETRKEIEEAAKNILKIINEGVRDDKIKDIFKIESR
jgi:hypothetical protein